MTDNNTQNAAQQESTTQPEANGSAGKMFTQEEVNSIIRERLARERAKGTTAPDNAQTEDADEERAALEEERQKLAAERQSFECERYCKENGIDTQLIELLGADEPEAFKAKTEKLRSIFARIQDNNPCRVYVNTGMPHGAPLGREIDGTEFFKPSKV